MKTTNVLFLVIVGLSGYLASVNLLYAVLLIVGTFAGMFLVILYFVEVPSAALDFYERNHAEKPKRW